jgi:hypothetical protein
MEQVFPPHVVHTPAPPPLPLPEAGEHDPDQEFLDKMRGWLMTVATLFVNMAFTAVLHPPDWLAACYQAGFMLENHPQVSEIAKAVVFLFYNVGTFATAIVLVLLLLYVRDPSSAKDAMTFATRMLTGISVLVACSFAVATADNWAAIAVVFFITVTLCVVLGCAIAALRQKPPSTRPEAEREIEE